MQIISGKAKGISLSAPAGNTTRPTLQRVKEAMFSAIQFDIEGRTVFEPFGGTGQLSLEALSRGALKAFICEKESIAAACIMKNAAKAGFSENIILKRRPAEAALSEIKEAISLIFLDPPYAYKSVPFIERMCLEMNIEQGAILMLESDEQTEIPDIIGGFSLKKKYHHSHTYLRKYIYEVKK